MKPLAEVIREAEGHFREKWQRQAEAEAARRETPEGERLAEARDIVRRRLPPFVRETADVLRARVYAPALLQAVREWTWESCSLALSGDTRIGKTTAAALLVKRLLARGVKAGGEDWALAKRIEWHKAARLANARRRHSLGEDEAPEVNAASWASLLVLDDLGWDVDPIVIGEVLDARYEGKRPTLVTTGLTPDQLLERYGDAVYRRIFEAGGKGRIVHVVPTKEKKRP